MVFLQRECSVPSFSHWFFFAKGHSLLYTPEVNDDFFELMPIL